MRQQLNETQILRELAELTTSPGYVHAIAKICQKDNSIYFKNTLKGSDLGRMYRNDWLNRTELNTLLGLMVKKPLDFQMPSTDIINNYIERTHKILRELHSAMSLPMHSSMVEVMGRGGEFEEIWHGAAMREPIFYATESAYAFQYRDFVPKKYEADDEWMLKNRGFTSNQAVSIAKAMCTIIEERCEDRLSKHGISEGDQDTWLEIYELSLDEVATRAGFAKEFTAAFFETFSFTGDNAGFNEIGDFNEVAARPLLPTDRGTVLLFSHYAIYEALYDSPFFWMWEDKEYRPTLAKHRGAFTEQFAADKLIKVFGSKYVHTNVNLMRGKEVVGEADVLVIYADRLIVLQAKAKKLTIAARKGNDNQLKKDFAAAIQDSYDQGWDCAKEILSRDCKLIDGDRNEVALPPSIKEVFLFNLLSEHYPALAFQANQFLKFQTTPVIFPPFVMDVFFLDVLTEMLSTPLRFLSFVKQRVTSQSKLMSGHELTILAYYLQQNLAGDGEYDFKFLDDSIAQELDVAMMVRRDGLPGNDTPTGILTKMRGTHYEHLIQEIETRADSTTLDLGFQLLLMSDETCMNVHRSLDAIISKTRISGNRHDITLMSMEPQIGICLHCNPAISSEAIDVLDLHCKKRKYRQRMEKWFGISVSPNGRLQFGINLNYPWEQSDEMDRLTANMKQGSGSDAKLAIHQYAQEGKRVKYGRNDPCYCGSGRKYKKCCMV